MKILNRIMLVFSVLALFLLVGNAGLLLHIHSLIEAGQTFMPEWMGYVVAFSILTIMLYHLMGMVHVVRLLRHFRDDDMLRAASFVIGFFSMFLLLVDVIMLNDIGHEFLVGYNSTGEWNIVFVNHGIHALFTMLLLFQCRAADRRLKLDESAPDVVKDEALYLTVHQTGICAGAIGLLVVFAVLLMLVPEGFVNGLLFMLTVVGLVPYGLAVLYWFVTKRRERPDEWYDEKQLADLSYGALVALVVSVFTMMVCYTLLSLHILDDVVGYGFPLYFFLTLLVFSGSTLYFNRRV